MRSKLELALLVTIIVVGAVYGFYVWHRIFTVVGIWPWA